MTKYLVSAFNHCNKKLLDDIEISAKNFWDANEVVETILKESGYDPTYMSLSIKAIDQFGEK